MSFLIKDILKLNSDDSEKNSNIKYNTCKKEQLTSDNIETNTKISQDIYNKPCSILEQTLTNTTNVYSPDVQEKYYNYYAYYGLNTSNFAEPYRTRENLESVYAHEQCWTYLPYPMMLTCEHFHGRRKGAQIRFTANQTRELEKRFAFHKYLSPKDRKQLADLLRLSDRQVKTWFQNRRAKWRRNNEDKNIVNVRLNYTNSSSLEQVSKANCKI